MKLKLFFLITIGLILLSIPSQQSFAGSRFSALPDFFGQSDQNSGSWRGGAEATCSTVTVYVGYPNNENPLGIPETLYDYVDWSLNAVLDKNGNTIPSETGLIGTFPLGTPAGQQQSANFDFTTPLLPGQSYYIRLNYQITGGIFDGMSGSFDLGAIGAHPYWQFRAGDTSANTQGLEFFCNPTIEANPPTVYVLGDVTELEGDGGGNTYNVILFLDKPSTEPIIVDLESTTAAGLPSYTFNFPSFNGYSTRGIPYGSAVCADSGDPGCITPTYTTITIPAGVTSYTVPISIGGDNTYESVYPIYNTHNVRVIRAGNARIGATNSANLLQRNDDPCQVGPEPGQCHLTLVVPGSSFPIPADPVTFLVDNIVVDEDDTNAVFTVTLSVPNPVPNLAITYQTTSSNRNAVAGEDYQTASGTLTFGLNETSQQVSIPLIFDPAQEGNESFGVTFSKSGTENPDTVTVGALINDVYIVPAQNAPSGTVNSDFGHPTFSWSNFSDNDYEIYIEDVPANQVAITQTINNNVCNLTTCSIDLTTISVNYRLNAGNYQWSIRELPSGSWVGPTAFTLTATPPGLVTLSPVSTNTLRPTYNWTLENSATNATQFQISLAGNNNTTPLNTTQWYSRASVCGSPTATTCSYTMPSDLTNGVTYSLRIKSSGPGGESVGGDNGYAGPQVFTVNMPTPQEPSGLTTNGDLISVPAQPTYIWNHDVYSTSYRLYISGAGILIDHTYVVSSGITCTSTCSIQPVETLALGDYSWWVQGINAYGSIWNVTPATFHVGPPLPIAPLGLTQNVTTSNVTFTWTHDIYATWYQLYVSYTAGVVVQTWYEVGNGLTCTTICSITPTVIFKNGDYTWWVQGWNSVGTGAWSAGVNFSIANPAPTQPTGLSISGSLNVPPVKPTYTWTHDPNTTWYQVWLNGPSGIVFTTWFEVGIGVTCTSTCSVTPNMPLGNGSYTWWVQGWNSVAAGAWSASNQFIVSAPAPAQPTGLGISGSLNVPPVQPTYTWTHDPNTTWYQVQLNGPSGVVFITWYEVGNGLTCTSTCSISPNNVLANGNYTWWVQGWNSVGTGAWSAGSNYTVAVPAPVQPTGLATSGNLTAPGQPTFTWDKDTNATWYLLYVSGTSGIVLNQWLEVGNTVICGVTCSVTPSLALPSGTYNWWVLGWNNATGSGPWSVAAALSIQP